MRGYTHIGFGSTALVHAIPKTLPDPHVYCPENKSPSPAAPQIVGPPNTLTRSEAKDRPVPPRSQFDRRGERLQELDKRGARSRLHRHGHGQPLALEQPIRGDLVGHDTLRGAGSCCRPEERGE